MEVLEAILAVAGGIAVIGGAGAVIAKWLRPAFTVKKDLETVKEQLARDHKRLQAAAEYDKAVAHALIALLENAETGNSTGRLRDAKAELQKFLIDR
jgi:hypothetical protein